MSFGASDRPVTKKMITGPVNNEDPHEKYLREMEEWKALCEIEEFVGNELPPKPIELNEYGDKLGVAHISVGDRLAKMKKPKGSPIPGYNLDYNDLNNKNI